MNDLYPLQIDFETAFGQIMGMADVMADLRFFAAYCTFLRHNRTPLKDTYSFFVNPFDLSDLFGSHLNHSQAVIVHHDRECNIDRFFFLDRQTRASDLYIASFLRWRTRQKPCSEPIPTGILLLNRLNFVFILSENPTSTLSKKLKKWPVNEFFLDRTVFF